eukprot:CFRG5699T1
MARKEYMATPPPINSTEPVHCMQYVAIGSVEMEENLKTEDVYRALVKFTQQMRNGTIKFRWEAVCRPPNGLCYVRLCNTAMRYPPIDGYCWDGKTEIEQANSAFAMVGFSKNHGKDVPMENLEGKSCLVNTARYRLTDDTTPLELIFYRVGTKVAIPPPAMTLAIPEGVSYEQLYNQLRTPYENFVISTVIRDIAKENPGIPMDDLEDTARVRWQQLTPAEKRTYFYQTKNQQDLRDNALKAGRVPPSRPVPTQKSSLAPGLQQPYPSQWGNPPISTIQSEVDIDDVVSVQELAETRFKRNHYFFAELFGPEKALRKFNTQDPEYANKRLCLDEAQRDILKNIDTLLNENEDQIKQRQINSTKWVEDMKRVDQITTTEELEAFKSSRPYLLAPEYNRKELQASKDYFLAKI